MLNTQLFSNHKAPAPENIYPVANRDPRDHRSKPYDGLWTSTWDAEKKTSAWIEWCEEQAFELNRLAQQGQWLCTPRDDIRIYTIDSRHDLVTLTDRYLLYCPKIERTFETPQGKKTTYIRGEGYHIDFERMSQDYDALHLTAHGEEETDYFRDAYTLCGWDCESTLWFRWCFSHIEQIKAPDQNIKRETQGLSIS